MSYRVYALSCDFGIGADIGGVPSFGEQNNKDTKVKRIPCVATQFPKTGSATGPTTVVHLDYCCYRHEVHLE